MKRLNRPSTQLKSVPLSRIDTADHTYRITTRTNVDDLLASIRLDGLLNRPFVIAKEDGFAVVSGFRRIAACKKLGMKEIMVRVLDRDLNSLDCLRLAIADNALQRPLDLLETSRALQKLSVQFNSDRRLIESTSSLGLPSNPSVIKKLIDLSLLPQNIQHAVMDDTISLSMAMELKDFSPACTSAFAQLFGEFKFSLNKQRQIITLVKEIARREGLSEQTVLEGRQVQNIIGDRDCDRGQRAHEIRTYLRQRRFPHIVKAETRFEYQRKQLDLGNDINFIPPKDFEGTNYTLNLTFSSISRLKALRAKLDQLLKHPAFKQIFEGKDKSSS